MNGFPPSTAMKTTLLLIVVLLAAGALLLNAAPALAGGGQTAPTPAPETAQPQPARGTSPLVGILVLLAPLVFLVWKSRGKQQPEIKGACCLPVIDENKRPFQILEDKQGAEEAPKNHNHRAML